MTHSIGSPRESIARDPRADHTRGSLISSQHSGSLAAHVHDSTCDDPQCRLLIRLKGAHCHNHQPKIASRHTLHSRSGGGELLLGRGASHGTFRDGLLRSRSSSSNPLASFVAGRSGLDPWDPHLHEVAKSIGTSARGTAPNAGRRAVTRQSRREACPAPTPPLSLSANLAVSGGSSLTPARELFELGERY